MPPASNDDPASVSLARDTRIQRSADQASADLVGDTVIMSMRDGTYYGLEAVGSRVWDLVITPTSLGDIVDRIVAEYDVEASVAWDDLLALVREMLKRHLVVRVTPT